MHIRPAVADDADQIAHVHVLSWQVGYRGMLPQQLLDGLRRAQRVPRWTATLRQATWPGRGTLVADDAGDIVGFADLRPAPGDEPDSDPDAIGGGVGEIASFYVLPAVWRRGVGRQLMAAAVHTLEAAGFTSAMLWVLDTNIRAIRFYSHLGWEPDGSTRDDVVGGALIRDVRYRRKLGAGDDADASPLSGPGHSGPR